MAPEASGNRGTWHVWIEEHHGRPQLVIEGELPATATGDEVRLVKAEPQGSDERDLLLTIAPRVQLEETAQPLKLTYSEALHSEHQYASITITDQGTPLARLVDIERRQPA